MKNKDIHTLYSYLEQCYDSKYSTEMNILIDEDIVKTFMPYLNPNEKIIWTAKPKQGLEFHINHLLFLPFAIIWLWICGTMAWNVFQSSDTIDTGFLVMITLFISIGVYMLIGHFIVDIIRRSKVVYAMSEQRILIRSGIFSKETDIINIDKLETLKLKERSNSNGTIELSNPPKSHWLQKRNHLAEMSGYDGILKLESIEKVREVYELISRFQAEGLAK